MSRRSWDEASVPSGPIGPALEGLGRIPPPPRRFWIGLSFFGAAILVIALGAPLVGVLTDFQWFGALGLGDVYRTRVGLQAALFFVAFPVAFAVAEANVLLALRLRDRRMLRMAGIRRRALRSPVGLALTGLCGLLALSLGLVMKGAWQDLVLFTHASSTGVREPVMGMDVSFYLLDLPFLHDVETWLMALLVVTGVGVAGILAWRGDRFDLRMPRAAIAHLSALLAAIAIVTAFATWLERYDYLYGHDGFVWGAGFTDVNARIPLATLRSLLAGLLAACLLVNIGLRRMRVLATVGAVWVAAAIIATIYAGFVQRLEVQPAELSQERPYIERDIAFTRQAYGLSTVRTSSFGGDAPITAAEAQADTATIDNLRLWDYVPLQETYQQVQAIRTYYTFKTIDLDRYTVNGRYEQVEISARELDQSKLQSQAQTWLNQTLVYTHGYGVAASPVAAVVGEGLPDFVAGDVPPTGPLAVTRPQIYFGEMTDGTVLAPSATAEFDYPKGADNAHTRYTGTHAPLLTGPSRLLWSLRTGDVNMLVSDQITGDTRVLYRRNVQDRVRELAPFLTLDRDPYPVVVGGRLYWIQDAYVTGSTYPYSQQDATYGENYIRNSVKVVVDAYEGTVDFYVIDPRDPITRAYRAEFPTMFKPIEDMPAAMRAHLRVPMDLFTIQAAMYATYHIGDPTTFYNREDVWASPLEPYYVLIRLPGESRPEYLLILPYTPLNKQNLVAWLAARNDGGDYGRMVSYVLPKDKVVFGPQQVANRIQQTPEISRDYTLLNQSGSQVIRGNLLVVPIGDSFLYFQPWYLKATGSQTSLPELKKVILTGSTDQSIVAYQGSLQDALTQLVGQPVGAPPNGRAPPPTTSPAVAALVQQALQHYQAAQAALQRGDLGTYQSESDQVGRVLQQIAAAEGRSTP